MLANDEEGPMGKYSVKVKDLTTLNDILRPSEGDVWNSACSPVYVPVGKSLHDVLLGLPVHVPGSAELAGDASVTLVDGQLQVSAATPSP